MFNRLAAFLLTDLGKKCAYFAAGTASTVALVGHVLPQTILIDKYKDIVHLYKNGLSVPLSSQLHQKFQSCLDLLGIEERDKHLYKPFTVYGFDIFSAGSSYSQYGVIVGLPLNFTYDTVGDIDKSKIKLQLVENSIVWDTEAGQRLLNSFVLSDKAQLYAIAREIKFRESPKPLLDPILPVIGISGTYGLAKTINMRLNLYARPLPLRIIMYAIVGAFAFGNYALCKDFAQVYYEEKVDKELKETNAIFIEGGKEFYSKLLERNIALRKLMGKQGESMFSVLGNENNFIRTRHIPLVQRRSLFEQAN